MSLFRKMSREEYARYREEQNALRDEERRAVLVLWPLFPPISQDDEQRVAAHQFQHLIGLE